MSTNSHEIKLNGDGVVIYSSQAERLYRLNGTAAYVWALLQSRRVGFDSAQIYEALQSEAKRLELEGADSFSLSETRDLMQRLVQLGLVSEDSRSESKTSYTALELQESTIAATSGTHERVKIKKRTVIRVLILFAAIDIYLKLVGFNSLLTRVQRYPTKLSSSRSDVVSNIAALDQAQIYYPKKQMCLQRSVALTMLLRAKGHAAQMVIGAQPYPAKAHAWVEVDNQVIGDSLRIKSLYHELFRV